MSCHERAPDPQHGHARCARPRDPMTARLLAKLEDFRLLPFLVLFSMVIGIAIGNALSVSDVALTPPIDSIKAIAAGTFEASVPNLISLGVPIGLFAMMYPAMTNIRLDEVGEAARSPRQLLVLLGFNYLVAPFVMLALANVFVSDPELHTGLVLYGLAPCIAMVIIFTYLARGNAAMALVFVALNSVIQMILIPVLRAAPDRERRVRRVGRRRERRPATSACRWSSAC